MSYTSNRSGAWRSDRSDTCSHMHDVHSHMHVTRLALAVTSRSAIASSPRPAATNRSVVVSHTHGGRIRHAPSHPRAPPHARCPARFGSQHARPRPPTPQPQTTECSKVTTRVWSLAQGSVRGRGRRAPAAAARRSPACLDARSVAN